jgi:hypothetical protein
MKKLLLVILLTAVFSISHAQVNTSLLTCIPSQKTMPQFSVQFFGSQARLTLKANVFSVPFTHATVDKKGDRWSVYENIEIRVVTTIPNDQWVSVGSGSPENYAVIAGAFCK